MTIRGLEALTVSNKQMVFFQVYVDFLDLVFIKVNKFCIKILLCCVHDLYVNAKFGPITISTIWQSGLTALIKYLIILQDPNLAKERLQCSLKRPSQSKLHHYIKFTLRMTKPRLVSTAKTRKYYSNRSISLLFIIIGGLAVICSFCKVMSQ